MLACCLVAREKVVRGGEVLLRRAWAHLLTWTVTVEGFVRVEQVRGVAVMLRLLRGSWRFHDAVRHDTAQHGAIWLRWS